MGLQKAILPASVITATVGTTIVARAKEIGLRFLVLAILTVSIPNVVFFLMYRKTDEFIYLKNIFAKIFAKFKRKKA